MQLAAKNTCNQGVGCYGKKVHGYKEVSVAQQIFRFSGKVFDYKGDAKSKEAKSLLGGKGAGLVMMAQQGLNVPPGFTITTDVCNQFREYLTNPTLGPKHADHF